MKPFFVYMLRCGDGSYYVGHTDDLNERMALHSARPRGSYTSTRHPLTLVYVCEVESRLDALQQERQIKGWSRAKKAALIAGGWANLAGWSRRLRDRRLRPTSSA